MIRYLLLVAIFLVFLFSAEAQYVKVEIGVDGFTCSMCAKSVENSIRRLPFVEEVQMDLNSSKAVVFFRKNKEVSIEELADQVYNSGFSIRSLQAEYNFPELLLQDNSIVGAGKEELHFLKVGESRINGVATIIFLNKRLISRKEYTHWEEWIRKDVKKNGKKDNVFYVTLWRG